MKVVDKNHEFEEMAGSISESISQMSDPVAIGMMLYQIAEERKNTNLMVQQFNSKIDILMDKIEKLEKANHDVLTPKTSLSDRDMEIYDYVKREGQVSADNLQHKFKYKGKNAASARLSKLFHEGLVEKEYRGRTVLYKIK